MRPRSAAPYTTPANGHTEIAELLIASDADVNAIPDGEIIAIDDPNETPLDYAIDRKHTEIANLLRKLGGKTGKELKAVGK